MAGLVDGEGCISIPRYQAKATAKTGYRYHALHLVITTTDPRMLVWVQERFGGVVWKPKPHRGREHYRPQYRWDIRSVMAEKVLKLILPYLVGKRASSRDGVSSGRCGIE